MLESGQGHTDKHDKDHCHPLWFWGTCNKRKSIQKILNNDTKLQQKRDVTFALLLGFLSFGLPWNSQPSEQMNIMFATICLDISVLYPGTPTGSWS